jgi:UDP-sugar transporter A1/2/3
MQQLSLVLLCMQNGSTPIILRWTMTAQSAADRFDSSQAVLCGEAIKVFMSLLILLNEGGGTLRALKTTLRSEVWNKPRDTLKLGVPAMLYYIQNIVLQLSAANLPAAVFQVSYQGKTLVVALCSVLMLQRQLKAVQWLALAFLALGLAVVQLARGVESKAGANAAEQSIAYGLLLVLLGCCCSSFASVYFEKMMKTGAPPS